MFGRLGAWCYDQRKLVLGLWVALLIAGGGLLATAGSDFREEFNLPASDSRDGFDILEANFGGQGTNATGTIVFRAEQGVNDPTVRAAMEALFAAVAEEPDVISVTSPYSLEGAGQISEDGRIAYANVDMPENIASADSQKISTFVKEHAPVIDGLEVERGTYFFATNSAPLSEALGLGFAIIILVLALGSVLAMGLSIGVAIVGIGVGVTLVFLLSHLMGVPEIASILGIMMGLGVGIDYALLIVTRYREQLHKGHYPREAAAIAIDTAGRSVVFAGCTVVISLLSLMLVGVKFVQSLGVAAAIVVAITIVASITLLPAVLGFAGRRIEIIRWRGIIAAVFVSAAMFAVGLKSFTVAVGAGGVAALVLLSGFVVAPLKWMVPVRPSRPKEQTVAYRWSRIVQHRPWLGAIAATAILLFLTIPVLSLRLGFSDESNAASDSTTKKAYNLIVEGFGAGYVSPLLLVADTSSGTTPEDLAAVTAAVEADPGVAYVSTAVTSGDGGAALWNLVPTTGPQEKATKDLVERLRTKVLPAVENNVGFQVNVTGANAVNIDYAKYLQSRIVYVFGAVLALSFVLLMVVFRSLFVPLKAVIMNLLSIGAAYGVVVALFQWGWLSSLTGVQQAPIEPWTPMLLFAIVFGLSMDYEVFLLSRVREEWHRTGDSRTSVADGLAATAKVITAAAAIMVLVFGSFLLDLDRAIKLLGVGLAVAVLLDATIVRMLLVPATMELLGDKNWWLPRWLDKLLPNIDVEGHAPDDEDESVPEETALFIPQHGVAEHVSTRSDAP